MLDIKKQALQGQKNKQATEAKNDQQPDIEMKVQQNGQNFDMFGGVPMSQSQFDLNALTGMGN